MESSPGSISVIPRRACSSTALTVANGECPVIAPVSPRQKSMYRCPSTSKKCAPCASRTNGGNAPAHFTIQFIGTPASSDFRARSNSALDLGRSSTYFFCSRTIKEESRLRSRVLTSLCEAGRIHHSVAYENSCTLSDGHRTLYYRFAFAPQEASASYVRYEVGLTRLPQRQPPAESARTLPQAVGVFPKFTLRRIPMTSRKTVLSTIVLAMISFALGSASTAA